MARFNSSLISNTITGTTSVGSPFNGSFTALTGTAPYTVTLANPTLFPGINQQFYNATSGTVTLSTPSGNFVGTGGSAASTLPVYAGNVVSITADGTNYIVISEDGSALTATSATISGTLTVQSSGGVAIAPSTTGNIDNVNVGATTRGSGAFNTLAANNAVTFTANTASSTTGTGTVVITGGLGVSGTINAASVSASLTGTIQTASQPNITSTGSLTIPSLTVDTTTLVVDATNDRVGIGTANPTTRLQVNNAADSRVIIFETGTTPYTATLELASQAIGTYGALLQYTSSAETLTLKAYGRTATGTTQGSILFNTKVANTTDTTVMTIHGFSGNVGIGTNSPGTSLEIYKSLASTTTAQQMLIINTDYASGIGTGFGGSIVFRGRTAGNVLQDNAQILGYNEDTNDNGYALGFFTRPTVGAGMVQRMTILRGGNVGIGITSPQTLLELNQGGAYTQVKHLILSRNENTRYNAYAGFGDQFGGNTFGWRFGTTNNNTDYPTLYMVNGNVGIGTSATPASPLTVSAVSGDGVPLLRLTSTSAPGTVNWISSSMNSSLTANASTVHLFGQAQSQYNSGYVGFRYAGASSSSNYLTLGLYASDYLLNILGNGNVGIGTTSPQVTFETGYTRVYNSGAAPSIGTGGPGKGLELHYVTSGRTQGEGGYAISYDRANSAYKAFTIDASAINLSQSGATKVTMALGMLNVEPNLNIFSSNAGAASASGYCELFRVGSSSLCTSGIFSLGATRGGYVAGGLFTWSTTHNGSGRGVITQLSSGEYSNFNVSADVASDGSVIICADWGSSQGYSISAIKFVGGYIDYSNAGTLWSSPSGSYPTRYTRSTISLGFKTQNGVFDGSLSKGSGSFKIEHPLPALKETHNLVHSFIEGPKADLIYRGKVALAAGLAEVNIDTAATMTEGTFELLCRDVQCFTTNETDWSPVRGSVTGNILTIECQSNTSTATISWMVIGERKDKHMYDTEWTDSSGRPIVEPLKNPVQTDFPPYPEHVNTNTTEENHGTI